MFLATRVASHFQDIAALDMSVKGASNMLLRPCARGLPAAPCDLAPGKRIPC